MCPFGTLHQFVGWLFNVKSNSGRIEQNRYVDAQYLKYAVLIVFLIMSSMGALQIGLLDPIVIMYRALTTVIAPASDMAVDQIVGVAAEAGVTVSFVDQLKFAPGVERRVFVGSFWVGLLFFAFVALNLWKPRSVQNQSYCRTLYRLQSVPDALRRRSGPAVPGAHGGVFLLYELHR